MGIQEYSKDRIFFINTTHNNVEKTLKMSNPRKRGLSIGQGLFSFRELDVYKRTFLYQALPAKQKNRS